MKLHRLLCALGIHWWARLGNGRRGCAVCFQQQRWIESATGQHGFWCDIPPIGRATPQPDDEEAA